MLPTYRTLRRNVADARRIVGDLVRARRAAEQEALENGTLYEKPTDLLQWMMDAAKGEERAPENLAQRTLILSLSSIHTTALTMTQALYDLCAHPEFLEPIREELVNVLREDGGWQKQTLNRFRKLDSLIKESQRFNPVFLVTFNRIYHHSMTLSDGTHLRAGTRIAVPSYSMSNDAAHVPGADDPAVFNPFRYSQLREDPARPENSQKFLLAMTDQSNMAWGFGKYACPGRFYAANEMKMILAHMLLLYDFKMPEGCGRPKNFTIDTDMYPDRSARLLMRERVKFADGIERLVKA